MPLAIANRIMVHHISLNLDKNKFNVLSEVIK